MWKRILAMLLLALVCAPLAVPLKPVKRPPDALKCLAWVVHDESRGESLRGSRAVLDVVLKRMNDERKGACEIIAAPSQFSGYNAQAPYVDNKEALDRYQVVKRMKPVTTECKYFHAVYVHPAWANKMTFCFRIGKHIWYKEKKHGSKRSGSR